LNYKNIQELFKAFGKTLPEKPVLAICIKEMLESLKRAGLNNNNKKLKVETLVYQPGRQLAFRSTTGRFCFVLRG
jgi:hypothetical protein